MSTIKVNNLESSTGGGVAAKLTSVNGGGIGTRNLIINGAMQVAQRGTSSAQTGYRTVDRFRPDAGGTDETPSQDQVDVASGTGPYTSGFRKAIKITNGNQTSGVQAADYVQIDYRLEAQDVAKSGWNYTSSSSFVTLSFWIKSSVSKDFQIVVRTQDGTSQSFQFETPTLSADTWTKVTKTIPGNSNLTFDNNVNLGFVIFWFPYIGTEHTNSANTLDAWQTSSASTYGVVDGTSWYTTNDATFELTGVQLELGDVATDFQHKSFDEDRRLCQRYFQVLRSASATGVNGNTVRMNCPLMCEMRSEPSVGKGGSGNINVGDMVSVGSNTTSTPSSDGYEFDRLMMSCQLGGFTGLTAYRVYCHEPSGSHLGLITADAEI